MPFLALLAVAWYRADTRHAQHIDHILDQAETPNRPAGDRTGAGTDRAAHSGAASDAGAEAGRPWWEHDASVFGDRARLYQRRD